MKAMLEVSDARRIRPTIELYSLAEINDVIQRLRHHPARYRTVLVNDSGIGVRK